MARSAFVSSLLTAAVLLAACGSGDGADVSPAALDRPAATAKPTAPTTASPTEDFPEGTDTDDASPTGGTEGLPGWPIESVPTHGAQLWAAYLAVGAPGDPELQRALDDVRQLWSQAGLGELGCDAGAAAALGRTTAEHAVTVYFPTEEHITEFRRRWDGPFVGAARVTTFCAD